MEIPTPASPEPTEPVLIKGPDGHIFTIDAQTQSPLVAPSENTIQSPAVGSFEPTHNSAVTSIEAAAVSQPTAENIGTLTLLGFGVILGGRAIKTRLSNKNDGQGNGHGASHGHNSYHGPKVPLLNRSRRYQIHHMSNALGGKEGKEVSRTSDERLDKVRQIMYDRITPDLSKIPTKIVLVDEYEPAIDPDTKELEINPNTGEQIFLYIGTRRELVANSGARGTERLHGRTGTDRSTSSITRDQETKAGQVISSRVLKNGAWVYESRSFSETPAASVAEKRLEKTLANANDTMARMQTEVDAFTKLYGRVILDDDGIRNYLSRTPMNNRERNAFLDLAVKARHAQHVKHDLIQKHYGHIDASRKQEKQKKFDKNAQEMGLQDGKFRVRIAGQAEMGWHISGAGIRPDPKNNNLRTDFIELEGPIGERIVVTIDELLEWQF